MDFGKFLFQILMVHLKISWLGVVITPGGKSIVSISFTWTSVYLNFNPPNLRLQINKLSIRLFYDLQVVNCKNCQLPSIDHPGDSGAEVGMGRVGLWPWPMSLIEMQLSHCTGSSGFRVWLVTGVHHMSGYALYHHSDMWYWTLLHQLFYWEKNGLNWPELYSDKQQSSLIKRPSSENLSPIYQ